PLRAVMQAEPRIRAIFLYLACAATVFAAGCATTAVETARNDWFEAKSPRFEVWTDGDQEQARALVVDLERFHQVVMATTSAEEREAAPPLRIFLARNQDEFVALTGAKGASGIFRPTYRGNYAILEGRPAAESSSTKASDRVVLFHEYSHYILSLE